MKIKCLKLAKMVLMIFVALNINSCSTSDSEPKPEKKCKVTSFNSGNLFYDELVMTSYNYNSSFSGMINLIYDGNLISKVLGGLVYIDYPGSQSNYSFMLSDDVEQNIVYSDNTITVTTSGLYTKVFVVVNDVLVSQTTTYKSFDPYVFVNYSSGLHEYEYSGSTIIEKKDGNTRRIFYLENGNLAKVELFFRDYQTSKIYKKIEYLFTNYDAKPNLLKGKFFIHGNFFKAFSRNNYKNFEMKYYDYIDEQYKLNERNFYNSSIDISNDTFELDCN